MSRIGRDNYVIPSSSVGASYTSNLLDHIKSQVLLVMTSIVAYLPCSEKCCVVHRGIPSKDNPVWHFMTRSPLTYASTRAPCNWFGQGSLFLDEAAGAQTSPVGRRHSFKEEANDILRYTNAYRPGDQPFRSYHYSWVEDNTGHPYHHLSLRVLVATAQQYVMCKTA